MMTSVWEWGGTLEAECVRLRSSCELKLCFFVLVKLLLELLAGDGSAIVASILNDKDMLHDERNTTTDSDLVLLRI